MTHGLVHTRPCWVRPQARPPRPDCVEAAETERPGGVSCGHSVPGLQGSSCDMWGESHLTPHPGQGPAWAEREGHT